MASRFFLATIVCALVLSALVPMPLAAQAGRPPLSLNGSAEELRCASVSGRYVAFPVADRGVALISTAPFPGSSEVGRLASGAATIQFSGATLTLEASGPDGALYGLVDEGITAGGGACIGFDKDRFTWPSDLLTYLRWLYREVIPPLAESGWLDGEGLHLGERRIYLTVGGEGVQPLEVAAVEGGLAGLRLTGQESTWYLRPFVLADGAAAVFVYRGVGPVYGADGLEPAGLVRVTSTEATPVAGTGFTLKLAGIVAE